MRSVVKENGIRGLFAGFGTTALRDAPFAGIYVYFYENLKQILTDSYSLSRTTTNMSSGILAGLAATVLTNPFDLIKTRIQLDKKQYPNLIRGVLRVLKEDGVPGFFRGMLPRLIRKSISSAISWTVYEEIVRVYSKI